MPTSENLGNAVGLIKSLTPPTKTYILWGHIQDILFPDVVIIKYWNGSAWVALGGAGGIPAHQTIDLTSILISSDIVNALNTQIRFINPATGTADEIDVVVTGTIWTANFGPSQYTWITGEIIETTAGEIFLRRYVSGYDPDSQNFTIYADRYLTEGEQHINATGSNATGFVVENITHHRTFGITMVQNNYAGGTVFDSKEFKINLSGLDDDEPEAVIIFKNLVTDYQVHPYIKGASITLTNTELADLSTGHVILPNLLGVTDKYYADVKLYFEFTPGSDPYTFTDHLGLFSGISGIDTSNMLGGVAGNILHGATRKKAQVNLDSSHFGPAGGPGSYLVEATVIHNGVSGSGIRLRSIDGGNASVGDGQLIIHPYYRLKKYVDPFI